MLNVTSLEFSKTRAHCQMSTERLLSDKHKLDYKNIKIQVGIQHYD